jgi:hypothetical protein
VTWWGDDYVTGGDYTEASANISTKQFGSIAVTNDNLTDFVDYFRGQDEPVVILLYGDLNPWLGDGNSVYKALGINLDRPRDGIPQLLLHALPDLGQRRGQGGMGNDFTGEGRILPLLSDERAVPAVLLGGAGLYAGDTAAHDVIPVPHSTGRYLEKGVFTDTPTRRAPLSAGFQQPPVLLAPPFCRGAFLKTALRAAPLCAGPEPPTGRIGLMRKHKGRLSPVKILL